MTSQALPESIGRYRVLDEIGRGAMGRVYRAHDPHTDRTVALKVLAIDSDLSAAEVTQAHARFLREARAAGRLAHPGIVAVYDADIDPASGAPYLAMELVSGRSLAELLGERGLLPWQEAATIAAAVAEALDHAHQRGVVHRDLKPANVLLADDGAVKVSDFGVAMLLDDSSTLTGTIRGTPSYMAPEQIRGDSVDGRSDLYSLGAVLYEVLTGEPPFRADTMVGIAHQAVHDAPRPPTLACPELPLELERVVMRAMAKSPEDRFATGAEMAAALSAVGAPEEPVVVSDAATVAVPRVLAAAEPPPPAPRPRTAGRRPWIGLAVAAIVTLAAVGVGVWLGRGPEPARDADSRPAIDRAAPAAIDAAATAQTKETGADATEMGDSGSGEVATSTADESSPAAPTTGRSPGSPAETEPAAPASPAGTSSAPAAARTAPQTRPPQPAENEPPSALEGADAVGSELTPPGADPPAATIEIHFINRIKDGSLTVSVDGEPIWTTPLQSPKNPLRRIGGEELIGFIPAPAGEHEIGVHVVNASERIDARDVSNVELVAGETRVLRVGLQALRSKLRLKWEP